MTAPGLPQRRQRGVAAIELALIMLFFLALLPVVLLFGRALFAYTALQKGVHDAARYMATLPLAQMSDADAATESAAFARSMVVGAMRETWPKLQAARVSLECVYADDAYPCGSYAAKPLQVRVKLTVDMPIDLMPDLMARWLPAMSSVPLRANATLRYAH